MTVADECQAACRANVLLVDDRQADLLSLESILAELGQNLVRASSGEEALCRLQEEDFAVILLDVQMQGLDGFATARQIRSREKTRHTPIIFLTAYESPDFSAVKAYALGGVDYLVKPLVPQILRAKVMGFVELFRKTEQVMRQADQLQHLQRREFEQQLAEHVLRETNRRKDEFLAVLSHELRNPLAPILNSLHILRSAGVNPAAAPALDMMDRQVHRLARLVEDLLDMSRLTQSKVVLRPERLDLARLVRSAAKTRLPALEKAGLALAVVTPETPVWMNGDPTRLMQVLGNLLDNAAKFSERGGRVTVRLTADPVGREAEVAVQDTGIGVASEMLGQVFDAFAQADHTLDRSRGGLGLGLSVARSLVELHGGAMGAASAGPGKGAEFIVRLPLEGEPAALSGLPQTPAGKGSERWKVLVIEDNPDAADSLRMLLEHYGHEVLVAHTGPIGVTLAQEWQPQVVVSDIGLPGLDGFGVAAALRHNPATAQIRLIALTGYGTDEDRRRSREVGFDSHLVKPVDPAELHAVLAGQEDSRLPGKAIPSYNKGNPNWVRPTPP